MKKFIVTLVILLMLGGAVFFFGWAQLTVPPGSYGIIVSKTHGIDPRPVRSGEFRWVWYKLIPTNVEIPVFRLEPVNYPVNLNSALPSGDSYAAFAGLGSDFSWEITGTISFSLDPDELTALAARRNIPDQAALAALEQEIAQGIELIVLRTLTSGETDSARIENILSGGSDEGLEREITGNFSRIRDFSLVIHSAHFPDFTLYRHVRLLYEDFLTKQRETVSSALGKRAESRIETQLYFDELERYGELLSKYPVLLKYLAMDKYGIVEP
jgi:hypothetical protein